MAYKKTTWVTGDVITADKMNNIEEGIESVSGSDSPNTKDIRDYLDVSMSQKGQKHITLRPDDFSELYANGKVLMPGSDASIAVETTNSAWKIYKYELGRAFVLRADQVVKNSDAAGCVPIAFRYKGVNYAVDYDRSGQYYLADTVLVSYNATNEAYAIEEFSFTETVRQEFSDSIICRDHAGEFDSLVVFGDSIFANTISNPDTGVRTNNGNGVTKQLANLMGVPLYKHAVNNATLSTKYTAEAQNVIKQIQDYIASPDGGSRPLFVIEGGTNDAYHYGVSNLGTYGSSDTTTIYGAIYYAINLLLSIEGVQPWQILVCTPIPKGIRALWDGTTSFSSAGWLANTDLELTTIGHAMYEIALNRQCSVINGYNAIFDELSSSYICQLMMGDDTHPTVYGSERYARYIYDTLFSGASTKEVEEDITSLKSALKYNSYDIFTEKGTRANSTYNGITYVWNGDTCTITGTATGYSVNHLFALSNLPSDVVPGKAYYVKTKTTNQLARLRIIFYNDSEELSTLYILYDTKITIPSNANKWAVSVFVSITAVFSTPVTVTIAMLSAETNYDLSEKIVDSLLSPFTPSESTFSVFDMPKNSYWSGFKNAFSDSVDIASELLANVTYQILKIGDFVYVVCPYSSQAFVGMVRLSDSAQFWVNLKDMREGGLIPDGTDFDSLTSPGVYFMSSGYNYIHSPFSSTYGGEVVVLTDPAKTTSIIQIVVTYSPSGNNLVKLRMSLNGSFPSQWSDVGGATNNYYTSEHYENTYNITATPTITADTNNYLASTGNQTDRTADIQAMLAQNGVCHLGPGLFMVSGVDIPSYKSVIGSGKYTTVRLLPSVETGYVFRLNDQSSVSNLRISGGTTTPALSSTVGTRHGILFEGTKISGQTGGVTHKRSSVDNVIISNFSGGGITCTGTGVDLDSNIMVTNCFIDHCNAGIYIPYYSEFHRFTNCAATYCYYGCLNNGGNNVFVNCDFSGNRTGVLIDNATNQSPNNSHGTYSACTINHSYSDAGVINQGTAIELRKANNGEIFSGLQLHYGKIKISDSIAIRFSDCQFGRSVAMDISNSNTVTFIGCSMYSAAEDTITQSNNTNLRFTECYTYAGDAYNPVA